MFLTLVAAASLILAQNALVGGFQMQQPVVRAQQQPLSRLQYANTADPPPRSSSPEHAGSFEERMRALIRRQNEKLRQLRPKEQAQPSTHDKRGPTKRRTGSRRPSFLQEVSTLRDYKVAVADEDERISVVRFYSPYCRSCKAATPAFHKLAHKHPELNWVEVPVTPENAALHQGLGVPSVPFGHIYIPGAGLVEELRMVRPQMERFANVLQCYVDGQCELPEELDENGVYGAPF